MSRETPPAGSAPAFEQRWGSRVSLRAVAQLVTTEGDSETVWVRDASLSGAFIETRRDLPDMARVSLCPSGRRGEWLDGYVVRGGDGGYGIEWLDPGLRPISALLSLRRGPAAQPLAHCPDKVSWRLMERVSR